MEYASFSVGPEADKYRLSVSGYSGEDAGDALAATAHPNRVVNNTPDLDNDLCTCNCSAASGRTGWRFNRCSRSVLNRDKNNDWNAVTDTVIEDVEFSRMLVKLD